MSYAYVGHRQQFSGFRGLGIDSAAYDAGRKCVEKAAKDLKFDKEIVKNCMAAYNAAAAAGACAATGAGAVAAPICGEIAAAATKFLVDICYPVLDSVFGDLFGSNAEARRKAVKAAVAAGETAENTLLSAATAARISWADTIAGLRKFYQSTVGGDPGHNAVAKALLEAMGRPVVDCAKLNPDRKADAGLWCAPDWWLQYNTALDAGKLTAITIASGKGTINIFCKSGPAGVTSVNYLQKGCVVDDPAINNPKRKISFINNTLLRDISMFMDQMMAAANYYVAATTANATTLKIQYRLAHPDAAAAMDSQAAQAKARADSEKQGYADRAAQAYADAQKKLKADEKKKAADEKKAQAARDKAVADQSAVYQRQQTAARNAELLRMIFSGGTLGLLWRRRG